MATLTLHDVPEGLIEKLQEQARRNGHSLVQEVVLCLEREVSSPDDLEGWLNTVDRLSSQIRGGPIPVEELVEATERESH